MDVVVQVGGWEHDCCGAAVERGQLVDLGCLRTAGPDGEAGLIETRHHFDPDVRVQGRVTDIRVVREAGTSQQVHRLPAGRALRGFDPEDDGHLEEPWTGEPIASGRDFLLTIREA